MGKAISVQGHWLFFFIHFIYFLLKILMESNFFLASGSRCTRDALVSSLVLPINASSSIASGIFTLPSSFPPDPHLGYLNFGGTMPWIHRMPLIHSLPQPQNRTHPSPSPHARRFRSVYNTSLHSPGHTMPALRAPNTNSQLPTTESEEKNPPPPKLESSSLAKHDQKPGISIRGPFSVCETDVIGNQLYYTIRLCCFAC